MIMKRLLLLSIFIFPFITGCEASKPEAVDDPEETGEVDVLTPNERFDIKLTKAQQGFVTKGNSFAVKLLCEVMKEEKESFMISPLSLEYALAMLCNGAAGTTQTEILNNLGFAAGEMAEVNEFCKYLTKALYEADNSVKLNLANALVANTAFAHLKPAYVSALENWYDALIKGFDFRTENAVALNYINEWAKEQTYGMIPSVLPVLDSATYLVLMNALYFKGAWNSKNEFDKKNTKSGDFTLADGKKAKVDYMNQESMMFYGYDNSCQMVSLPYGNGAFAMDIILPHEGVTVGEVAESLKADYFKLMPEDKNVKLKLPIFETENNIELNKILTAMGINCIFDLKKADFTQMTDDPVFVSRVFQKTKIKVNEKGSEAAAVTVIVMETSTGLEFTPPPVPEFYATRPFIYSIRETSTNTILFMGVFAG